MNGISDDLKKRVKELITSDSFIKRNQTCSNIYEVEKEREKPEGEYSNIGVLQLAKILTRLNESRKTDSLGKYVQQLAVNNGYYHFDEAFFGQAQITRPYWSKLIHDKMNNPQRETILRIAILFKCDLDQTHELLSKAGYIFSDCNSRDQLVFGCIEEGIYDFADIEELIEEEGLKSLFN